MIYRIKKKQLRTLIKAAVSASEDDGGEICGLVIDNGYCLELTQVRNKSKKGGSSAFYMDDIRKIEKALSILKYEIVGTFHSHPFYLAKPGERDLRDSKDGDLMLIIDCLNKEAGLWKINKKGMKLIKFDLV